MSTRRYYLNIISETAAFGDEVSSFSAHNYLVSSLCMYTVRHAVVSVPIFFSVRPTCTEQRHMEANYRATRSPTPSRETYMTTHIFATPSQDMLGDTRSPHRGFSEPRTTVPTPKPIQQEPQYSPHPKPTDLDDAVPTLSLYQQVETPIKPREVAPRRQFISQPLFGDDSNDAWITVFGV